MTRNSDLVTAVEQALRAPSVHNTQPWRWRLRPDRVELHADCSRRLAATDPDGRDLLLSCGAALHHLRVALAARGLGAAVAYLPDPADPEHLATVTPTGAPDPADAALFRQVGRRRTDRRRMSHVPVPADRLEELAAQARRAGADLVPVSDVTTRQLLGDALTEAAARQRWTPGYAAELQLWTRRGAGARDGVLRTHLAAPPESGLPLRLFTEHPGLSQPKTAPGQSDDDAAALAVVVTTDDTALDRLRAGEALSAVLLAATGHGLATTPLSQATEVERARAAVRAAIGTDGQPQILVRVGWPASTAANLPDTPRRDLRSVLLPS